MDRNINVVDGESNTVVDGMDAIGPFTRIDLTPEQLAEIDRRLQNGEQIVDIAVLMGLCPPTKKWKPNVQKKFHELILRAGYKISPPIRRLVPITRTPIEGDNQ